MVCGLTIQYAEGTVLYRAKKDSESSSYGTPKLLLMVVVITAKFNKMHQRKYLMTYVIFVPGGKCGLIISALMEKR